MARKPRTKAVLTDEQLLDRGHHEGSAAAVLVAILAAKEEFDMTGARSGELVCTRCGGKIRWMIERSRNRSRGSCTGCPVGWIE